MKNFPKLSVCVITFGLLLSNSCKKNDPVSAADACSSNANLVSSTGTTYGNNPTKANCDAYIAAINKYIDGCSGVLTSAQIAQYKASVNSTKCQ